MVTPVGSGGAGGGRPTPTGGVPGETSEWGGDIVHHPFDPRVVSRDNVARGGAGESTVTEEAGKQVVGRRVEG